MKSQRMLACVTLAILTIVLIGKLLWHQQQKPFTPQEAAALSSNLVAQLSLPQPQSMDGALIAVAARQQNPYLRQVVMQMRGSMRRGSNLPQALAMHPDVFSQHYIAVMTSADQMVERTGNRALGLQMIAQLKS